MPVLARLVEAAGIPTVIVTMMPILAEKHHNARIVGVEFPFGHAFGMRDDQAMQLAVSNAAIELLAEADGPGARRDVDIEWPVDRKEAYRAWQPPEPAPAVKANLDQIRRDRRQQAEQARSS